MGSGFSLFLFGLLQDLVNRGVCPGLPGLGLVRPGFLVDHLLPARRPQATQQRRQPPLDLLLRRRRRQAAQQFLNVIQLGIYSLVPNYHDNFTEQDENNAESIFEVQFSRTVGGTADGAGAGGAAGVAGVWRTAELRGVS